MLCPLVSDDFPRAVRAIRSALNQQKHNLDFGVHVVVNSKKPEFIQEIVRYCGFNNIKYTITESDGTPSTGKNAVFDVFKNSDYTHLSQLDGDDIFYPTFLTQVQRHLKKYPTTDVLSTIPLDIITSVPTDSTVELTNGLYAFLWGIHYFDNHEWVGFVGEDPIIDGISVPNYGRLVLYSKKIVEMDFSYDREIMIGEDKKIHFDFLLAHQKDEISYWFTTASDMWCCDRTSPGIQSQKFGEGDSVLEDTESTQKIRDYVLKTMIHQRSAPGEIPIDYSAIALDYDEKIKFLNEFL
jgi:hypothetical protein